MILQLELYILEIAFIRHHSQKASNKLSSHYHNVTKFLLKSKAPPKALNHRFQSLFLSLKFPLHHEKSSNFIVSLSSTPLHHLVTFIDFVIEKSFFHFSNYVPWAFRRMMIIVRHSTRLEFSSHRKEKKFRVDFLLEFPRQHTFFQQKSFNFPQYSSIILKVTSPQPCAWAPPEIFIHYSLGGADRMPKAFCVGATSPCIYPLFPLLLWLCFIVGEKFAGKSFRSWIFKNGNIPRTSYFNYNLRSHETAKLYAEKFLWHDFAVRTCSD